MAKSSSKKSNKSTSVQRYSPGRNVFLALTLVPLVIGIIFVGAWVLDIELLGNPQSQIIVGVFFFLLAFSASNAVQKRWRLSAGWGLLAVADIVTLTWLNIVAQIVALSVGLVGLVVLGMEFYKQYQQGKTKKQNK